MKTLKIGAEGFEVDPGLAEDVIAILGRRGRGKTNTAVVLVEELHAAGARFCVADPVGVWWGLKSSRDGKAAGIPVVVMGGEHADVPLEEAAGKVIADFVADPGSPSVVLDFRGFRKGQMARFMTDFLEQLYHRNRSPLHLVLDEADQFAPQRVMVETARLVGAAEDVCKMGRARGLHPMVITQRPAALNKNVLTQAGLLVAHQLTGPQDQKAVDDWIRANADEGQRSKFMDTIAGLAKGVAWFWQPEAEIFQRVHVRARRTFDSSATPKRGERAAGPRVLAKVDLEALKERISATIERAKAEDPRELRKRIAELELAAKARPAAPTAPAPKVKRVEVPVLKPATAKRLEAAAGKLEKAAGQAREAAARATAAAEQAHSDFVAVRTALAAARAIPPEPGRGVAALIPDPPPAANTRAAGPHPAPPPSLTVARAPRAARESSAAGVGAGETKILKAIAQHRDGVTREQLSVLTGYKRSSRDTYVQRLRAVGYVHQEGDILQATASGIAALGEEFEPLPTGAALREYWSQELPEGEKRLLEAITACWPSWVDRDLLDVGFKRSSRDTYLQRLAARRLIDSERGRVRASEHLF